MNVEHTDTVIIGGGQAGLAMSSCLTEEGVPHVVLERGRIAERWRSERWDSLRMLTPNWMSRLPGMALRDGDPDGFMSKDDVVSLLEAYARSTGAPVREDTPVIRVAQSSTGFSIETRRGRLTARNVVVATGQCGEPVIPPMAVALDPTVAQLHASQYRNPRELPVGGVLVVGAGASGIQIAAELADAGRSVVLAVGSHARAVRSYRGRDVWWWLDRTGSLGETVDEVGDIAAARRNPSLGLTGADGGRDIDLGVLSARGVRIAGRLIEAEATRVRFGHGLDDDIVKSDERLWRLLDRFDLAATALGLDPELGPPLRPLPVRVTRRAPNDFDLHDAGVSTVVWSTGYRPSYPWLDVPVTDERGEIVQRRGVTDVPGLFVLGLRFQWRRDSHFLGGVGRDAEYLALKVAERSLRAAVA